MNRIKGFTLVEIMIAVVIVAVLAAIAVPSYQNSVMKSRRSDATMALSALQLAEEKYRASNAGYSDIPSVLGVSTTATTSGSGYTSNGGYYTITITNPTATGYTLTATAVAGKSQASDTSCAPITLTQTGGNSTYGPNSSCWK